MLQFFYVVLLVNMIYSAILYIFCINNFQREYSLIYEILCFILLSKALKNEIKLRESAWSKVYWEMVEPVVTIRTLRARLVSILLHCV